MHFLQRRDRFLQEAEHTVPEEVMPLFSGSCTRFLLARKT
jgi:hypothetical protein